MGNTLGWRGSWEDERFLFAHHHTGNGFFFTTFITITGKQSGSWSESIFFGGVDAAPQCANRTGESGLFFFFCLIFSRNLLQCSPLGDTACGSVLFGSSFRCSDEHASPLCYWIFSLRLRKKDKCLIINSFFIFVSICEAFWSGLGGRKAIYEQ